MMHLLTVVRLNGVVLGKGDFSSLPEVFMDDARLPEAAVGGSVVMGGV